MFSKLSISTLLKSLIAILVAVVTVQFALDAWDSWRKVVVVDRIMAVADASSQVFAARYNLQADRTFTFRDLMLDTPPAANAQTRTVRDAAMAGVKASLASLDRLDFPGRQDVVPNLEQTMRRLAPLQEEAAQALLQPKTARRPTLAREVFTEYTSLMDQLDRLSAQLTRTVKLDDAFIDATLELKQLAWMARTAASDGNIIMFNGLSGQPTTPDALLQYTAHLARVTTAWTALEDLAAGLPLPPAFLAAMDTARRGYLAPDEAEVRLKTLKALIAGEKQNIKADDWGAKSLASLATLQRVAEAALDAAKDYAAKQHAAATRSLWQQLALLAVSVLAAIVMMVFVSRRITQPLHDIQAAMHRLASGDMTASVSFTGRKDEIGALADTMQFFKDNMIAADRLRDEQKTAEQRAAVERAAAEEAAQAELTAQRNRSEAERKRVMNELADEFESAVGQIIDTVSAASGELEGAAAVLTRTADSTQQLSGMVAAASEQASSNVQSVASATEEMTTSVGEIGRQVQESSNIARQAVKQAEKTDARIAELSKAAARIGDVVKLITAIAEQTNLLALNATIEAARAGEAGKGFAVVAQEVKALASQTAKATDEIGAQIAGMQTATQESVLSIKEIGGTIGRISEIASTIAAAVEQQGAATQEIARNVSEAARGTTQVATNITDVNRGASETGTASAHVLSSAQALSGESQRLKREVEKFLGTVRAA